MGEARNYDNTAKFFNEAISEARRLADQVLDETVAPEAARDQLAGIGHQFENVRTCLRYHHDSDHVLDTGAYEYLTTLSYAEQIPPYAAAEIAAMTASKTWEERERIWSDTGRKTLRTVLRFNRKAEKSLAVIRKRLGRWARLRMILRLRRQGPLGAPNRRGGMLGFGDVSFMTSTFGAAMLQLARTNNIVLVFFNNEDSDHLLGNSRLSLEMLETYLHDVAANGKPSAPFPGTLMAAASVALVESEFMIGRHRLSRAATEAAAKVYLMRAAACLGHAAVVARAAKMGGSSNDALEVYPTDRGDPDRLREEQRVALISGRSHINAAVALLEGARKRRWRDPVWRVLFRADLRLSLKGLDVLANLPRSVLGDLINLIGERIASAEVDLATQGSFSEEAEPD
jgi:hypothetical protein